MKRTLGLLFLCLLTGGCLLPDGDPPAGHIVSNPTQNQNTFAATPEEAVEKVIPGLTATLLLHCPGSAVAVEAPPALRSFALLALTECGKLSGNRPGKSGLPCRLRLSQKEKQWLWQFFCSTNEVWHETVLFR